MLPIPKKLLAQGVRDMVRVSDARMSGTSYGACVLHVAPGVVRRRPARARARRRHHRARRPRAAADAAGGRRGAGAAAGRLDAARDRRIRAASAASTRSTSRRPTAAATSISSRAPRRSASRRSTRPRLKQEDRRTGRFILRLLSPRFARFLVKKRNRSQAKRSAKCACDHAPRPRRRPSAAQAGVVVATSLLTSGSLVLRSPADLRVRFQRAMTESSFDA